ncbi:hypothetical protein KAU55_00695 [Candidatus Bathyarchaeota archaeon]|nr:hypothetical protein [Candidatus Bathyarchaeota archaeon]
MIQWGRQGRSNRQLDDEILAYAKRHKKHHYNTRPGYRWGCTKKVELDRRRQAVIYLRKHYKLSINQIAKAVPACIRTIHNIIKSVTEAIPRRVHRRIGPWKYKIVNDNGTVIDLCSGAGNVKTRILSFILGFFNTVEAAMGDEPP